MTGRTRLRQAVLVAADFAAAEPAVQSNFGLRDAFHDPSIKGFGLCNAVFTVGDTFLEVISPVREGTTAGRYLERFGDGGYMAMFQLPDIAAGRARVDDAGVRIVFDGGHPDIDDIHLHPKDVGGAIVALNEARPPGSWRFGGEAWEAKVPADIAPGGLTGLTVRCADPAAMAQRWGQLIGAPVETVDGGPGLRLDGGAQTVRFVDAAGGPEGIAGIGLAIDPSARAGRDTVDLCGVTFTLTDA
jgi:hypothetical protein